MIDNGATDWKAQPRTTGSPTQNAYAIGAVRVATPHKVSVEIRC